MEFDRSSRRRRGTRPPRAPGDPFVPRPTATNPGDPFAPRQAPSTTPANPFGASPFDSAPSAPPTFAASSTNPFGADSTPFGAAPAPFGASTTPSPPFGAPATGSAPFGGAATGSTPFGGTATNYAPFGGQSLTATPFGGSVTSSTPFGDAATKSTPFGGAATASTPFGGAATNSAPFGGGGTNAAPFGGPATASTPFGGDAAPLSAPFGTPLSQQPAFLSTQPSDPFQSAHQSVTATPKFPPLASGFANFPSDHFGSRPKSKSVPDIQEDPFAPRPQQEVRQQDIRTIERPRALATQLLIKSVPLHLFSRNALQAHFEQFPDVSPTHISLRGSREPNARRTAVISFQTPQQTSTAMSRARSHQGIQLPIVYYRPPEQTTHQQIEDYTPQNQPVVQSNELLFSYVPDALYSEQAIRHLFNSISANQVTAVSVRTRRHRGAVKRTAIVSFPTVAVANIALQNLPLYNGQKLQVSFRHRPPHAHPAPLGGTDGSRDGMSVVDAGEAISGAGAGAIEFGDSALVDAEGEDGENDDASGEDFIEQREFQTGQDAAMKAELELKMARLRANIKEMERAKNSRVAKGKGRQTHGKQLRRDGASGGMQGKPGHHADRNASKQVVRPQSNNDNSAWRKVGEKVSILNAVQFVGTCQTMCPAKELEERILQRDISVFETVGGLGGDADPERAVKKYRRSAAISEQPTPDEIRPPPILLKTMTYLLSICDSKSSPFVDIHNFVRDRTRSLRQDFTYQGIRDESFIKIHEESVRFHIMSEHRLVGTDPEKFSSKQNREQLDKCLISLREIYELRHEEKLPSSPNEPEMQAYYLLTQMTEPKTCVQLCTGLPREVRRSLPVQFALQVVRAASDSFGNYFNYFACVRAAPYLFACLMHTRFLKIRCQALEVINSAHGNLTGHDRLEVSMLTRRLGFEDDEETGEFCELLGMDVLEESKGEEESPILVLSTPSQTFDTENASEWIPTRSDIVIESKTDGLKPSEIIAGVGSDDFTLNELPHCSSSHLRSPAKQQNVFTRTSKQQDRASVTSRINPLKSKADTQEQEVQPKRTRKLSEQSQPTMQARASAEITAPLKQVSDTTKEHLKTVMPSAIPLPNAVQTVHKPGTPPTLTWKRNDTSQFGADARTSIVDSATANPTIASVPFSGVQVVAAVSKAASQPESATIVKPFAFSAPPHQAAGANSSSPKRKRKQTRESFPALSQQAVRPSFTFDLSRRPALRKPKDHESEFEKANRRIIGGISPRPNSGENEVTEKLTQKNQVSAPTENVSTAELEENKAERTLAIAEAKRAKSEQVIHLKYLQLVEDISRKVAAMRIDLCQIESSCLPLSLETTGARAVLEMCRIASSDLRRIANERSSCLARLKESNPITDACRIAKESLVGELQEIRTSGNKVWGELRKLQSIADTAPDSMAEPTVVGTQMPVKQMRTSFGVKRKASMEAAMDHSRRAKKHSAAGLVPSAEKSRNCRELNCVADTMRMCGLIRWQASISDGSWMQSEAEGKLYAWVRSRFADNTSEPDGVIRYINQTDSPWPLHISVRSTKIGQPVAPTSNVVIFSIDMSVEARYADRLSQLKDMLMKRQDSGKLAGTLPPVLMLLSHSQPSQRHANVDKPETNLLAHDVHLLLDGQDLVLQFHIIEVSMTCATYLQANEQFTAALGKTVLQVQDEMKKNNMSLQSISLGEQVVRLANSAWLKYISASKVCSDQSSSYLDVIDCVNKAWATLAKAVGEEERRWPEEMKLERKKLRQAKVVLRRKMRLPLPSEIKATSANNYMAHLAHSGGIAIPTIGYGHSRPLAQFCRSLGHVLVAFVSSVLEREYFMYLFLPQIDLPPSPASTFYKLGGCLRGDNGSGINPPANVERAWNGTHITAKKDFKVLSRLEGAQKSWTCPPKNRAISEWEENTAAGMEQPKRPRRKSIEVLKRTLKFSPDPLHRRKSLPANTKRAKEMFMILDEMCKIEEAHSALLRNTEVNLQTTN